MYLESYNREDYTCCKEVPAESIKQLGKFIRNPVSGFIYCVTYGLPLLLWYFLKRLFYTDLGSVHLNTLVQDLLLMMTTTFHALLDI